MIPTIVAVTIRNERESDDAYGKKTDELVSGINDCWGGVSLVDLKKKEKRTKERAVLKKGSFGESI